MSRGKLYRVRRGIYAVGRPELSRNGRWMAALLACGSDAALSHRSAAALWGIEKEGGLIDVTVPASSRPHLPGVRPHRRDLEPSELRAKQNLKLTSPSTTIIDLAPGLSDPRLERTINEADSRGLLDPNELLTAAEAAGRRHGARKVRALLAKDGLIYTESAFEQRLLSFIRRAGLSLPLTQHVLCGYRVDLFWPEAKLVVEADSLTYHRTPSRQSRDAARDQALTLAGYTPIRVTHRQLRDDPAEVITLLTQLLSRPYARIS